jgi:quercetin dioxygenase-like cupin family protein
MQVLLLDQKQMQQRVARFKDLKPMGDLVQSMSGVPEDLRQATSSQTVYGLTSPTDTDENNFWDQGAVSAGTPNFGAVYVTAKPGQGVGFHIHRYSYENFIALKGTWRISWNTPDRQEHLDLEPFDMVSIPPGAVRRFECVGDTEGLLLAFAYAAEHSLTNSREAIMAPSEVERLEKAFGHKGPEYRAHLDRMRQTAETISADETEEDRKFAREIAEFVSAEIVDSRPPAPQAAA